jgi:hypothetical protein
VTRRVFLDANVLFNAAHNPSGLGASLFVPRPGLELLSCPFACEETRRNLTRKASSEALSRHIVQVQRLVLVPDTTGQTSLPLSKEDTLIFLSALQAGSHLLLTGDRRFAQAVSQSQGAASLGMRVQTLTQFFQTLRDLISQP